MVDAGGAAPPDETAIAGFLEALEKLRIDCERQGKYDEAELAKTRLQQVTQHEENRRREELKDQQKAERIGIEETQMSQMQEFNEIWERKITEFEGHAANLRNTLAARHKQEYNLIMESIAGKLNRGLQGGRVTS